MNPPRRTGGITHIPDQASGGTSFESQTADAQPKCRAGRFPALRSFGLLFGCLLVLPATNAQAHDVGLSSVMLRIENGHLDAHITFAAKDVESLISIDTDDDGDISAAEFDMARGRLEEYALDLLEVQFDGATERASKAETRYLDQVRDIYFHVAFPQGMCDQLRVRSTSLAKLARGHRQYIELQDQQGERKADRMLSTDDDVFEVELRRTLALPAPVIAAPPASPRQTTTFWSFLKLGVEHIWTGYDHVAFLLALMIVGGTFRSVLLVITSFTVAHTITLALATLDLVKLNSAIVEPLIAATIVYVGIENIVHRDLKWRWILTFVFGLIHGLGFASVLRDLGIGAGTSMGVALPLISFNLGVEFGQVVIAAVVLPIVWKLQKRPSFVPRFVPACSLIVALAGGWWLVQRTLLN